MKPEDQTKSLTKSLFPQAIRILNEDSASGLHGGPVSEDRENAPYLV